MKVTNQAIRPSKMNTKTLIQLLIHFIIAALMLVGLFMTPLRAQTSLWQDHNHYAQLKYKVGDVLFVNIEEVVVAQFEFKTERGKDTKLTVVPDKSADFIPKAEHSDTVKSNGIGKSKNNGKIVTTVAVRIVGKEQNSDAYLVKGTKTVQYGDQFHSLSLEGVVDPNFAQNHSIKSVHVANLKLILSGANLRRLRNDIELDTTGQKDIRQEDKQKILLEYFRRYFGEMN